LAEDGEIADVFETIASGRRLALWSGMSTRMREGEAGREIDATKQDGPDSGAESHEQTPHEP